MEKKIEIGMQNLWELKTDFPWNKPVLILGKGPSLEKVKSLDTSKYTLIGLNEASLYHKCNFTHFIDINVFTDELFRTATKFIAPIYPHTNFKPDGKQLTTLIDEQYREQFYYYNHSKWKEKPYDKTKIIKVKYFSSEAVFNILVEFGFKQVFTLGIDGGKQYHPFFKQKKLTPLTNGRESFDDGIEELKKIKINWVKL